MKSITKIVVGVFAILLCTSGIAQIKNTKTETVKISGNCGMCKTTIEKAGNKKKIAIVVWDKDSKMATLTYDTKKTNHDAILKQIALVGYDSDYFLAPDNVYAKLPECCQYTRNKKTNIKTDAVTQATVSNTSPVIESLASLKTVFDSYFMIKDALVKTDANTTSQKANDLLQTINAIKMETLKAEEHIVWMKVVDNLKENSKLISATKDVEKQRTAFTTLSDNMYSLIKVSKQPETVYYQHCPMYNDGKGANWLSKESVIKNPYFGSQMMGCGKIIETIK